MKKLLCFIGIIIFLSIISYVLFVQSVPLLDEMEAIEVGREKYLEFLWMVDGAFYSDIEEYSVNGQTLSDDNKTFTCDYGKDKNSCVGRDFIKNFDNLFAHNIIYDKVYGDNTSFSWYKKVNDDYLFSLIKTCSSRRMPKKQNIEIFEITRGKVIYHVTFSERIEVLNKVFNRKYLKEFVLVYEKGKWKISNAYYRDNCGLDYYIA